MPGRRTIKVVGIVAAIVGVITGNIWLIVAGICLLIATNKRIYGS